MYLAFIPSSISRGVGQHEVCAGYDDTGHEGGGDQSPHHLPVQTRTYTCHGNIIKIKYKMNIEIVI